MSEYKDVILRQNMRLRRFKVEDLNEDSTWHRDRKTRLVEVIQGKGWKIQVDNKLPLTMNEGDVYRIPGNMWHRIIPAESDLVVLIKESDDDTMDVFGVDVAEVIDELGEEYGGPMSPGIPAEMTQDILLPESKKKINPGYLTKDAGEMRDEIRKQAKKRDDDPTAYTSHPKGGWKADYDEKGQRYKTKPSPSTLAFHKRFGENDDIELVKDEEVLLEGLGPSIRKALKNKAKLANAPLGVLTTVYRKGLAAWKTGHKPGSSQHQWAMGRVNSFLTGGKARQVDAAQWEQVKKFRKNH